MTGPGEKKYERWEHHALQGIERDIKDHVREQQSQLGYLCDNIKIPSEEAKHHVINDNISHPSHYTKGKIEVWDFIADQKLNYNRGCILKYICRAGIKDKSTELEDLKKALAYLEKEIKEISK